MNDERWSAAVLREAAAATLSKAANVTRSAGPLETEHKIYIAALGENFGETNSSPEVGSS